MSVLPADLLGQMDAWWRAANYLSVGQVYLLDNPLLRRPPAQFDVKPRLLRSLGNHARAELRLRPSQPPDPGLRARHDLHRRARPRAPGLIAHAYLEGTYSELYPEMSRDEAGCADCCVSSAFPAVYRATQHPNDPATS